MCVRNKGIAARLNKDCDCVFRDVKRNNTCVRRAAWCYSAVFLRRYRLLHRYLWHLTVQTSSPGIPRCLSILVTLCAAATVSRFLGCDAACSCRWIPTFRRNTTNGTFIPWGWSWQFLPRHLSPKTRIDIFTAEKSWGVTWGMYCLCMRELLVPHWSLTAQCKPAASNLYLGT
jgi:hypothetical protein